MARWGRRVLQVKSAVSETEHEIYARLARVRRTTLSDLIRVYLARESYSERLITAQELDEITGANNG
jgi:hypothetical protein